MHLIAALASGVRGGENGTATVYNRGTTVAATLYATFEGDLPVVANPVPLDQYGAAEIYVTALVDVEVFGSDGVSVRSFTAGDSANAAEVRSLSFSGHDYISAASGASYPTTAGAIFDLWKTSAGALDFNVLVGGVSKTLQSALAGLGGIFFNVKDAAYGAVGDGTTDDTTAIQGAVTAAAVNGGVVYFPAGTYRVTTTITVGAKVSLMGVGPGGSYLRIDHATADALTYSNATSKDWQFIQGLRIDAAQVNTGAAIRVTQLVKLAICYCYIGGPNTQDGGTGGGIRDSATAGSLVLALATTFEVGGATSAHVSHSVGSPNLLFCRFVPPATWSGGAVVALAGGVIIGCEFEMAGVTSGSPTAISLNATGTTRQTAVIANDFPLANAGASSYVCINAGAAQVHEFGNRYGNSGTVALTFAWTGTTPATAHSEGQFLATRHVRKEYIQDDTAAVTVHTRAYGSCTLKRNTNGNQTVTLESPQGVGWKYALTYWNSSGGNIATVTLTTVKGSAFFALNTTLATTLYLESVDINGSLQWVLVSPPTPTTFTP